MIEVCVLNLFERFDNHNVIMVQDLNEKTGNEHPDENCLPGNVTKTQLMITALLSTVEDVPAMNIFVDICYEFANNLIIAFQITFWTS